MNVYSARPHLVGLALYTVTDNYRDCVQSVVLGRRIPAVNRKPVAKCKIQTMVQQLLIAKPDIKVLAYRTCIRGPPPLGGGAIWYGKTRMAGLPDSEKI